MLLILHIVIATASLVFTGISYMHPSKNKIGAAYVLVAATLASGTALVLQDHSKLTQSCQTGLAYLAVVTVGILLTQRKLAKQIAE
jgi:hypothetical protein